MRTCHFEAKKLTENDLMLSLEKWYIGTSLKLKEKLNHEEN
jgi:hypothetical protein